MHNFLMIIGRVTKDIVEKDNYYIINLAVQRGFKNEDGIYECDFFNIKIGKYSGSNYTDYVRKGDLIAIKGRLQNVKNEDEDGNVTVKNEIIADRISFLSSQVINKEEIDLNENSNM